MLKNKFYHYRAISDWQIFFIQLQKFWSFTLYCLYFVLFKILLLPKLCFKLYIEDLSSYKNYFASKDYFTKADSTKNYSSWVRFVNTPWNFKKSMENLKFIWYFSITIKNLAKCKFLFLTCLYINIFYIYVQISFTLHV